MLSDTLLLADALLGTLGLDGASLRGASLSVTVLLAEALPSGVLLSGTLQLTGASHFLSKVPCSWKLWQHGKFHGTWQL